MSQGASHEATLCTQVAGIITDFRSGEVGVPVMDAAHVARWVHQFDEPDRLPILAGMSTVLQKTYYSRARTLACIGGMVAAEKVTRGVDRAQFWRSVAALSLQAPGKSQGSMLELFDEALRTSLGFGISDAQPDGKTYLYLDDALFSGNQAGNLLKAWIEREDIRNCRILGLFMGAHSNADWYLKNRVLDQLMASRSIEIDIFANVWIENQLKNRYSAQVLWPTAVPSRPSIQAWEATLTRDRAGWFAARQPGGKPSTEWFGSEEVRQVMERAFFEKGADIFGFSQSPDPRLRPLEFAKLETQGFGTLFATHWNSPNNGPLVLHWGDQNASGPLGRWYPLLPRRAGQRPSAATDFSAFFEEE